MSSVTIARCSCRERAELPGGTVGTITLVIVLLQEKEFLAVLTEKPRHLLRKDFVDEACAVYQAAEPFMQFLCRALGLAC